MIAVKDLDREDAFIVFATKEGLVKRSNLTHFSRINKMVRLPLTSEKMMN